jgi:cell fate (sporulation/competence/biofilm development) regulator YlbF (YheA/YmcA/DUF963 family)
MRDERIRRISQMERAFDRAQAASKKLEKALEAYSALTDDIAALSGYLSSEEWKADFSADEAGELPHDIKRGVLSEDGLYDFLEHTRELSAAMKEISEKISKV